MNKTGRICKGCGDPFETRLSQQVFCSYGCRKKDAKEKYSFPSLSKQLGIDKNALGAIGEYRVCVDLLARGYDVYRAISFHSPFDLVVSKGAGPMLRIDVKTAYRRGERLYFPLGKPNRYDVIAAVTVEEIAYIPPLEELEAAAVAPGAVPGQSMRPACRECGSTGKLIGIGCDQEPWEAVCPWCSP